METRRLNITATCKAVYNSAIDVPIDLSLDEAIRYAKEHINEIPTDELEYISDTDQLDEENCCFDDEEGD